MDYPEEERNRRSYERFSVGFNVSIYSISDSGPELIEESTLNNVSGGGLCFLSSSSSLYHPGQRLLISISLPGTDELDARLEGNATVAWVGAQRVDMQGIYVGISMDDLLDFNRRTRAAKGGEEKKS